MVVLLGAVVIVGVDAVGVGVAALWALGTTTTAKNNTTPPAAN